MVLFVRFIFMVLFSISSYGHYVVIENHNGALRNPDENDFYQAYDLINSYAWPMILAFPGHVERLYHSSQLIKQKNIELAFI